MIRYTVIVDGIGVRYDGPELSEALGRFEADRRMSEVHVGQPAGKVVTMLGNGEIYQRFDPEEE